MKRQLLLLASVLLLISARSALSEEKSYIIGFKARPGPSERAMVQGARGVIKRTFRLIPAMVANLPEEEIEKLRKNRNVDFIEENWTYSAAAEPLAGNEYNNSWGGTRINADIAHAGGNRGAGIRIAVLDTGINGLHRDLDGNYRGGYDFVFNDNDPDDEHGHGTHVAGIIAAEENGVGVIGVAPEADLFAVRVLDGGGFGMASWIIAGIEWAVDNNIDVINLSLQGPHSVALEDACNAAYNAGVLLVAAGGNSLSGGAPVTFPAAYASVIAVTATDASDAPANFAPIGEQLELAAPGVNVLSTAKDGSYGSMSGTSQAAPHVAGVAALCLLANAEDLNGDGAVDHADTRLKLQQSAMDLGDFGKDPVYGYGLVDAASASTPTVPGTTLILTRTPGPPALDMESVTLEGMLHEVTIMNFGLSRVTVEVLEDGVLRKDLSETLRFRAKDPQDAVFWLDAAGTRYDVFFTPSGKSGGSAGVVIRESE